MDKKRATGAFFTREHPSPLRSVAIKRAESNVCARVRRWRTLLVVIPALGPAELINSVGGQRQE